MRNATVTGWRWLTSGVLAATIVSSGCQSANNTQGGAVAGGAIGAGLGALAAGPRHALLGALAGGAIGAGTGAVVGNSRDQVEKRQADAAAAYAAAANAPPVLSLQDIAQLTANNSSDAVIINQIRTTGSRYTNLTPDQIVWLQQQRVSQAVIAEMQATVYRAPPRVYSAVPQPVYVAQPPPPAVGFGVTYGGWR